MYMYICIKNLLRFPIQNDYSFLLYLICLAAIPDHMMIVECQQYSIILLTFNNHVISYCGKKNILQKEWVIKKNLCTPSLLLYKILP